MRISSDEVQGLLERIRDATRPNFHLACSDLFTYLDAHIPDNPVLVELNADRQAKWSGFPSQRPGVWTMPAPRQDRESLAYDLFRRVAEMREDGRRLLFWMYHQNFDQNVDRFRGDFLRHFADALTRIGRAEPVDVASDHEREKQQKFGILDAPNLLDSDLAAPAGVFGRAVIYFDLDNFKAINSRFTERVVDETLLPAVHRLVASAALNQGHAYAEGGDEMIVLLPNSTLLMGAAFAESLRGKLSTFSIDVRDETLSVTASFGVAGGLEGVALAEVANRAKRFAKENGKNCVAIAVAENDFSIWKTT